MPIYLGVHDRGQPMPEAEMVAGWESYKKACQAHGAEARKAFISPENGRAFCVTEADSAQVVEDAHKEAEVPLIEVLEVQKLK